MESSKKSLSEFFASIKIPSGPGFFKKILAFSGPAYLVSVGYMDPGNWATDIAGGSQFGYKLIWVLVMSNIMAILLQSLSARLGIVRGRDLAQASKETYGPFVNFMLYLLAEIAIAACDLAEVLGMAIGLQLLFDIPLVWGVSLTFLDTFLLLFLINRGMRKMEAFILVLIAIIGGAFLLEMILAKPDVSEMVIGLIPSLPGDTALYIAIGIIGATVMPHNLYLHSSLVQSRNFKRSNLCIKDAIKYNFIDSVIALNMALFINVAILVLAAATFYKAGMYQVSEIKDAHKLLQPLLGSTLAPTLFAIALIASGQSSTLTGTLAGQIIMEGYLNLRITPWIRRVITRFLAIIPAILTIIILGEGATGKLLILSQVILSLQLGFAVIPLIHSVSDKKEMGVFAIGKITKMAAWLIAIIIVSLNVKLVFEEIKDWIVATSGAWYIWTFVIPIVFGAGLLLLYITFRPLMKKILLRQIRTPHEAPDLGDISRKVVFNKIVIAIDFSKIDSEVVRYALSMTHKESKILLVHIVETAGAVLLGKDIDDFETHLDHQLLEKYKDVIRNYGLEADLKLGFGNPVKAIPKLVKEFDADLLVMGSHGHNLFKDIIFGTVINTIRHKVKIPVFMVK